MKHVASAAGEPLPRTRSLCRLERYDHSQLRLAQQVCSVKDDVIQGFHISLREDTSAHDVPYLCVVPCPNNQNTPSPMYAINLPIKKGHPASLVQSSTSGLATNSRTPAPMLIVRSSTLPRRRRSSAVLACSRALCTALGPDRSLNSPKESSLSAGVDFPLSLSCSSVLVGVPASESSGIPRLGELSPLGVLVVLKRP